MCSWAGSSHRGSWSQARVLRPRLPTGARQMIEHMPHACVERVAVQGTVDADVLRPPVCSLSQQVLSPCISWRSGFTSWRNRFMSPKGSVSWKEHPDCESARRGVLSAGPEPPHPTAKAKILSPVHSLPCGLSESPAAWGPLLHPSAPLPTHQCLRAWAWPGASSSLA